MEADCEFIRECELQAKRFQNLLAPTQLNKDSKQNTDPCLPDVPKPQPDMLRYQFLPLPRHYIRKPIPPAYPPLNKVGNVTSSTYFYYPRPVKPVILARPNYFHYKPTNIFTGTSTYKYAYRPYVIIEEIKHEPIKILPPNMYEKKRIEKIPRKPCETTTSFYFYEKEVKPRNRARLWWQKGAPYVHPTTQVETETSTSSTYKVPPYSKPIRAPIPKGTIYFGTYKLRS